MVSKSLFLRNWYKVLVQRRKRLFFMAIRIASHLYLNPYSTRFLGSSCYGTINTNLSIKILKRLIDP